MELRPIQESRWRNKTRTFRTSRKADRTYSKGIRRPRLPYFPRVSLVCLFLFIVCKDISGPNPITYQEIKAWKELTQTPLSAREVEAVKRLDLVYMRVMNG
jgi:hypothetical protein